MEAAAGVSTVARGVSVQMPPSQPSRKEWRPSTEHPVGNSGNEELEMSKPGQSDERLIYEHGREPADVDFCSITIDGNLDNDILRQRLHSIMKQRDELQQIEIELRAQLIARSEVMEIQSTYDAQIKEHANASAKLREQLREREQAIHELERKMEDKERELHATRLDNEAAWAKEDLLIEQNKELASFRRERDNSEAERSQHLKQIHDLQEHIQEKERHFLELQEKHRIAQETILIKDEQMREFQAWLNRVQEMDALQSTTNHSLQAELRDRTDQYNQLWVGCQRQFAEMERVHTLQLQQLHQELSEAKGKNGNYSDESHASQSKSKDVSHFEQSNGNQLEASGSGSPDGNSGSLSSCNAENIMSFISSGNALAQPEHVPGLPIAPSSLLGMPTYLPPGQVTTLHPFVMHQQGISHSLPSHVPQSHIGHFHSVPAISSFQQWQNQQAVSEGSQYQPSHDEHNLLGSDSNYDYKMSGNGQSLHTDYLGVPMGQGMESHSLRTASNEEGQAIESIDKSYLVNSQPQQKLQLISSQFPDALRLDPCDKNENMEKNNNPLADHGSESQGLMLEKQNSGANIPEVAIHPVKFSEITVGSAVDAPMPEAYIPTGQNSPPTASRKTIETALIDERSLLACIVRTIPPVSGGRIRISSTLPNRLGKMLAPLHWHDYKRKYGKLDDFVASHPELFVIEGDYIQLREGAQEIIAATAAAAKVAAAAAAVTSHSALLPSVAVTPLAQSHRLKKVPSIDSKPKDDTDSSIAASRPGNATDNSMQSLRMQSPHSNGVPFSVSGGVPTVKILSKPKDHELNGTELRPGRSSVVPIVGSGANSDSSDLGSGQNKGRPNANFLVKHGRVTGAALSSRR